MAGSGERYADGGPLGLAAVDGDGAAVRARDLPGDVEPEAEPARPLVERRPGCRPPGRLEELRAELDALPFGLLRVDAQGTITAYNAFEARTAGHARSNVVGRRFSDVAPCMMVKEFAGAIERGFAERRLDRVLRYIFPVHEAECIVSVRLFYDERREQTWIFVTRRRDGPPSASGR